ncbi:MAG: hypothetical protein Q9182_004189 [Xanthomendoza sp. 2 TL-2023]
MSARALNRIVSDLKDRSRQESSGKEDKVEELLITGSQRELGNNSSPEYCLENPWSQLHSFYANMGGFVFDLDEIFLGDRETFTSKVSRLTLTPRGVALLAACGYLPQISTEDILDKNKSDNVSKVLSVLQAIWMLAQIISRLKGRLPITLLEVNTLAHIICAIIIYALWWNKPKLINEPTKLRGHWAPPIAAYMFMSSQISGWRRARPGILKKDWIDPEISILAFNPPGPVTSSIPTNSTSIQPTLPLTAAGSLTRRPSIAFDKNGMPLEAVQSAIETRLESSGDLQSIRWKLAAEAMALYPALGRRIVCRETTQDGQTLRWSEPLVEELVDDSIGNWATGNLLRAMSGFVMGMIVWSASMAYGGVHAAAWYGHFPSQTEAQLWRASSICVAGSGLTWIIINMLARTSPWFKAYWKQVETLRAHWISLVVLGALAFLCGLAYVLARLYLVVESFISLRKLPVAAYQTLEWTQIVPHL